MTEEHIRVIIELTVGRDLNKLPPGTRGRSALQAMVLTAKERTPVQKVLRYVDDFLIVYEKGAEGQVVNQVVRDLPNLTAIDTYRTTTAERFLHLGQVIFLDKQHPIFAC